MGGKAIMPEVVNFLASHPGQPITLQQLSTGISVEPVRIQKALSNAIGSGIYGDTLECVHRGQVWVWRSEVPPAQALTATTAPVRAPQAPPPPAAPAVPQGLRKGDVVEVMGLTREGDAVASDENGQLYRVVPL